MSDLPTVMVSSTFYDLQQVRADLRSFIEDQLGYSSLLSEYPSFPVDPDLDTAANCQKRVAANADILVLVIGGRYGTLDRDTGKSVTNLEYLAARQKGIPIYAFAQKQIIPLLSVWKKTPDADFSDAVDTPLLLAFLDEVRAENRVWTFPFETAQDIVGTLRVQLSRLFGEALALRGQLLGSGVPAYLTSVSARTARIAIEKPRAWEYFLFSSAMRDQIDSLKSPIREYDERLRLGEAEFVSDPDSPRWMQTRLHELSGYVDAASQLVNESLQVALGPQGAPGDPAHIVWVAQKLGDVLARSLEWSRRVRCARVEEAFNELLALLSGFTADVVEKLCRWPNDIDASIRSAIAAAERGEQPEPIEQTLTIAIRDVDVFAAALDRARRLRL